MEWRGSAPTPAIRRVWGGAIYASGSRPIRNRSARSAASRTSFFTRRYPESSDSQRMRQMHPRSAGVQHVESPVPAVGCANRANYRGHHGQPRRTPRAASAAPHPENPVAPGICPPPNPRSSAQNARTVAPACCDRGACASTGRSVRNRTSNCIPQSLLFPNLRAPEWLLASARLMRSR